MTLQEPHVIHDLAEDSGDVHYGPASREPYVTRCGHALARTGFELAPWVFEHVVPRDPVLLSRMMAYPQTGSMDGMDSCDRDRLLAAVSGFFLREPWVATRDSVHLKSFLQRLVAAVTAKQAWA